MNFLKKKIIGNYSNFYKYSIKNDIKAKKNNNFHPRYETEYGKQLQFDWKLYQSIIKF